jgi:hypothetical protein
MPTIHQNQPQREPGSRTGSRHSGQAAGIWDRQPGFQTGSRDSRRAAGIPDRQPGFRASPRGTTTCGRPARQPRPPAGPLAAWPRGRAFRCNPGAARATPWARSVPARTQARNAAAPGISAAIADAVYSVSLAYNSCDPCHDRTLLNLTWALNGPPASASETPRKTNPTLSTITKQHGVFGRPFFAP